MYKYREPNNKGQTKCFNLKPSQSKTKNTQSQSKDKQNGRILLNLREKKAQNMF